MNKLLGICLFSLASAWVMAQENNAEQAFLRGDFAQAITYWQAAEAEPEIHLRMVDAYQHLGHYQAGQALLENLEPTISERSLTVQAEFWYAWSRLYMAQGEDYHEQADAVLIQAFAAAQQVDSGNLTARLLNHQATLQQLAFLFTDAEHTYQQALRILTAKNTPADTLVRAKIHLNRWRNAQAQRVSVNTLWQQAQQAWLSLPPSHAQVMALLQLAEADSITDTASRDNLFQTAWDSAAKLKNSALQAYVTGLWGGFQQNQGHSDAALKLTRQAVFFAQQQPHSARLYRWYHQLARLLHQRGAETAALTAYRKAVKHLRSRWHQEAYQGYRILPSRFPEQIVPLYMGFVELLLQQAEKEQGEKQQQLLHEAVAVVEQFKRLELEDYLQTPCKTSDARACPLLKIAAPEGTAILYPLIFEKYLVLLLKIGDKLHVIKQATGAEVLRQEVAVLGSLLRSAQHQMPLRKTTATQYATFNCAALSRSPELSVANPFQNIGAVIKQSQRLHQWLIKPLQGTLSQNDIRHLLIVPDGILRTLPFSALHDGNSYLIQRYAVSISPGLCLTPIAKPTGVPALLLGGLSQSVAGMPALQCVPHELDAVRDLYTAQDTGLLLNERFTKPNLSRHWQEQPYNILHLASHGQFSGQIEDTFILTYDGKLNLNDLAQLVRQKTQRNQPVDLLTLSACETAAGNDRAALGLAGVAVKAGARHALASLWRIDDRITPKLLIEFYQQLQNPTVNKAQALQQAQRALLENPEYKAFQHPYYWAAFLLIGGYE